MTVAFQLKEGAEKISSKDISDVVRDIAKQTPLKKAGLIHPQERSMHFYPSISHFNMFHEDKIGDTKGKPYTDQYMVIGKLHQDGESWYAGYCTHSMRIADPERGDKEKGIMEQADMSELSGWIAFLDPETISTNWHNSKGQFDNTKDPLRLVFQRQIAEELYGKFQDRLEAVSIMYGPSGKTMVERVAPQQPL